MPPKEKRILKREAILLYAFIAALLLSGVFFLRRKPPEILPSPVVIQLKEPEEPSPLFEPKETPANIPAEQTIIETPLGNTIIIEETGFPNRTCLITRYGAIKGGKVSNTDAFAKAIDDCATSGGGTVLVPPGIWLTGPVHLKSNINLHLKKGAEILFSTDFNEYLPTVFSRFEGIEYYNYSAPIYTINAVNVAITGEGTLNGQGSAWWNIGNWSRAVTQLYTMGDDHIPVSKRVFGTMQAALRPAFIDFVNCRDVLVEGVKIVNGPMWTIHPLYSTNVVIRGVTVNTNPGPSTDGVIIDSSQSVLIENSTFNTGDDAIVLKSGRNKDGIRIHRPTENVIIRHNTIQNAHAAVALGSETSGDIRNVFVSDISADNVFFGLRIKSSRGRGGIVENIFAQNIRMRRATIDAIQITAQYDAPFSKSDDALPLIRNVHIQNVSTKRSDHAIEIIGLPEQPITDISFESINLTTKRGIEIKNASNIRFNSISAIPEKEFFFSIEDSSNISINNSPCSPTKNHCLRIPEQNSHNIDIENSGFSTDSAEKQFPKENHEDDNPSDTVNEAE